MTEIENSIDEGEGVAENFARAFMCEVTRHKKRNEWLKKNSVPNADAPLLGELMHPSRLEEGKVTHREFRGLFEHRLEGVESETISDLKGVLSMLVSALEKNDVEALEIIAESKERLLAVDTWHGRLARIEATIRAQFEALTSMIKAGQELNWETNKMPLLTRMRLAECGFPVSDEVEAEYMTEVMEAIRRQSTHGKRGPLALTAWLLHRLEVRHPETGAPLSEKQITKTLGTARTKRAKNLAAENS